MRDQRFPETQRLLQCKRRDLALRIARETQTLATLNETLRRLDAEIAALATISLPKKEADDA